MISIDTDILKQLVAVSSGANEAISNAVEALNQIATHNDWGCKEKYSINEYTNQNKKRIRLLQENSKSILDALRNISNDFENTEGSISNMFSSVEALIASVLRVTNNGFPGYHNHYNTNNGGNIGLWTPSIFSNLRTDSLFESFEASSVCEPIPICVFKDIDLK